MKPNINSQDSTSADSAYNANSDGARKSGWLHEWEVLQVSSGLVSHPVINSIRPTSSSPNLIDQAIENTSRRRCISLHSYCLDAILHIILKTQSSSFTGTSHEGSMMLGWSLPKWTGYGPWMNPADRGGPEFLADMEKRGIGIGYWAGCGSQRGRWKEGVEGSHLLAVSDVAMPIGDGTDGF